MSVDKTLEERGNNYGEFKDFSEVSQSIKTVIRVELRKRNKILSNSHQEALDMIVHKISRIINGNPNHTDSWHDIAGYATLAEKECNQRRLMDVKSLEID